jgi:hypothetical protein
LVDVPGTGVVQRNAVHRARPSAQAVAFVHDFVERVREIAAVRRVAVAAEGDEINVCTIVDAEPQAPLGRNAVYTAELAAYDQHPDLTIDFRVVNVADFPARPIEQFIPADANIVYSS